MNRQLKFAAWLLPVLLVFSSSLRADEFAPALLNITERDGGWVDVTWKVPAKANRALSITPILPEFLEPLGEGTGRLTPGAWIETRTYRSGGQPLNGAALSIDGLAKVPTDVLVRIKLNDGTEHSTILRSHNNTFTIPLEATKWEVTKSYTHMGFAHILEGYDHLLFVLALLLLIRGFGKLIKTITAFTIAHSITLALATFELVNLPAAPTEAIISLSIVFLATEILRVQKGETPLSARYPWLVAFAFGLFHGLGFAGALAEVGVPLNEVPLALLMFNVGVELGQLAFVAVVAGLLAVLHLVLKRIQFPIPKAAGKVLPYAVGITASFWTIERVLSFTPWAG